MASPAEPNSRPLIIPRALYVFGDRRRKLAAARSRRTARSDMLAVMEQGKVSDVATLLAELREQVRGLDERVETLGRHL